MTRQTFEVGQKVMVWEGRYDGWKEAEVVKPDVAEKGFYNQPTHYVGIRQVSRWRHDNYQNREVINSRNKILGLVEYEPVGAAIAAQEEALKLRREEEVAAIRKDFLEFAYLIINQVRLDMGAAALADYLQAHVGRPMRLHEEEGRRIE